jgi:hypothetical protein
LSRFENPVLFVASFLRIWPDAGVEGPWVPLMLGDAQSLLEHFESNLQSNQLSKLSLTIRPRVIACYRDCFVRVLFLPDPSSSRSLSLSLIYFLPCFFLSFSCRFSCLVPADEAAGMVPFSSQFQRDGSYIPSGLSICEPWPCARKISFFRIFFSLHGLEIMGKWFECTVNSPFPFSLWTPT